MKVRTKFFKCDLVLKRFKQADEHFSNEVLSALKITNYNALPYPISPDCSGKPSSLLQKENFLTSIVIPIRLLFFPQTAKELAAESWKTSSYNALQHRFTKTKNVLVTLSDRKLSVDENTDNTTDYYAANVLSTTDYYAFGMEMPGRSYTGPNAYRYGFNGMERDDEAKGNGNSYTTEFRQYDPRLGRWTAIDPIVKPWESPYAGFANNPIYFVDPSGLDPEGGNGETPQMPSDPKDGQKYKYRDDNGQVTKWKYDKELGWVTQIGPLQRLFSFFRKIVPSKDNRASSESQGESAGYLHEPSVVNAKCHPDNTYMEIAYQEYVDAYNALDHKGGQVDFPRAPAWDYVFGQRSYGKMAVGPDGYLTGEPAVQTGTPPLPISIRGVPGGPNASGVIPTLEQQAANLVKLNGGRARVTLRSDKYKMEVDLTGKAHNFKGQNIKTPHVKISPRNFKAAVSDKYNTSKKFATYRAATQEDIRMIRKYLEKLNK